MKLILIFLSVMLFQLNRAQELSRSLFRIGLTNGVGLYTPTDLKDLNKAVESNLSFDVETVNNFPPQFFPGGYFLVQIGPSLSVGLVYQFHSTGSRIGQKDYSGSYSFDQIISSNMFGWRTEIDLNRLGSSRVIFHLEAGFDFSKWRINEKLTVGNVEEKTEITYVALSPYIEPSFGMRWQLSRVFGFSLKPSYHIDLGGKYHLKNDRERHSENKSFWNGPRISVNLDFQFIH